MVRVQKQTFIEISVKLLVLVLVGYFSATGYCEPNMQVNNCVALADNNFTRWTEGGFLVLNDKDILLAVTGYTGWTHDDSPADIYGFWSHDGGVSWTPQEKAIILQSSSKMGLQNVMSVSLIKLHNGDVLMAFTGYNLKSRQGIKDKHAGLFVKRSKDNGKSWDKPRRVLQSRETMFCVPGKTFQLASGRIILPSYSNIDLVTGKRSTEWSGCLYSDDNGYNWKRSNEVVLEKGLADRPVASLKHAPLDLAEPSIVPLKDGRLLMFLRTNEGELFKAYSSDNGATWGKPMRTGIPSPASMPTLAKLQNGDIMLVFNLIRDSKVLGVRGGVIGYPGYPQTRINTMVSKDDGDTWGHLRYLDGSDEWQGKRMEIFKMTVASVALVGDDDVLVVWSRAPRKSISHYRNLYDYRIRKFNLDWLYAGNDPTTYKAPR